MPITRIEISGYRGFSQLGALDFAVPNGKLGSGLTIITGSNNAGKSCILECLRARSGSQEISFTTGTRNAVTESVEIKYVVNDMEELIKSVTKGSSETRKTGIDRTLRVFVLPSRRAFAPYFGKSAWSREQYMESEGLPAQRASVLQSFQFRLFNTMREPTLFNSLLSEALGIKPNWTIDQSDQGQYFLKFFNGEHSHSSDGMGEGIISVFAIVDSLYDSKAGDVIAIDEPELSLHPSLQKRVSSIIARFAQDRQIVISTHSPYFVDLIALSNGGQLARVTTTEQGTKIHQLTAASKTSINKLCAGNINNPHVFGLDAKELFFQEDKIILTEGQEDVIFYPIVAEQLHETISGSFFGWGAGGASNVEHLCRILKDLGFKKVAGLLDNDKIAEVGKLKIEFPEFHFACIPAKDIRTKPARKSSEEVAGLLDNKKKIKPEFKEPMQKLFTDLSTHMNSQPMRKKSSVNYAKSSPRNPNDRANP